MLTTLLTSNPLTAQLRHDLRPVSANLLLVEISLCRMIRVDGQFVNSTGPEWMSTLVAEPLSQSTASSLLPAQYSRRRFAVPLTFALLAASCLIIDMPVARFCVARHTPRFLVDLLKNAETFGHSAGVTLIVLTVFFLDSDGKRRAITAALSAVAGGMAANVLKLCVGRFRPQSLDLQTADLSATFIGLFPLGIGGSGQQSFPSAHTATAVGLAVALAAFYPRGRLWFGVLALLVALQRIETSAHYPSDVCAGAAIGWLAGQMVVRLRECPARSAVTSA